MKRLYALFTQFVFIGLSGALLFTRSNPALCNSSSRELVS